MPACVFHSRARTRVPIFGDWNCLEKWAFAMIFFNCEKCNNSLAREQGARAALAPGRFSDIYVRIFYQEIGKKQQVIY